VEQTLSTRAAEIEYWSVIAGDGRLIGRGKGQRNVVAHEDMPANVSRYLNKQSNGATFLHSHPTTITGAHRSSLSGSDLRSQFRSAYREIIAVTDVGGGVYRARATVNVFLRTFADATEEAQELALKISRDAQSRVGPHYQKYKHEIWEFENLTAYGHIANLIMSEWGYIRYTATNLSKDEMFLERYMRAHVALPKRPFGL
jgi:post-segregation antitoxin (ccd killing protein)